VIPVSIGEARHAKRLLAGFATSLAMLTAVAAHGTDPNTGKGQGQRADQSVSADLPTLQSQQTQVAKGMSAEDVLVAEQAIENNWANYTLQLDGDGTALRTREWPDLSFTDDLTWDFYDQNGKLTGHLDAAQAREIGVKEAGPEGVVHRPWKHLPIITKFDEVTPTTAKTRTVVVFFLVTKATAPGRPDGAEGLATPAVPQAGMAVYHDTWRKVKGIWMKSSSALYASNCGWFPSGPPGPQYTCVDELAMASAGSRHPVKQEPAQAPNK
jgi:hypothetical protein